MIQRLLLPVTILAVVSYFALVASAFAADDAFAPAFYVQSSAGVSALLFDDKGIEAEWFDDDPDGRIDIDFDLGWDVEARAGYRMLHWLAVEMQYQHGRYEADVDFEAGANGKLRMRKNAVTANFRLYLPKTQRFQPYALAGIGFAKFLGKESSRIDDSVLKKDDESGIAGRFAIGMDCYFGKYFALNIEAGALLTDVDWETEFHQPTDPTHTLSARVGLLIRYPDALAFAH